MPRIGTRPEGTASLVPMRSPRRSITWSSLLTRTRALRSARRANRTPNPNPRPWPAPCRDTPSLMHSFRASPASCTCWNCEHDRRLAEAPTPTSATTNSNTLTWLRKPAMAVSGWSECSKAFEAISSSAPTRPAACPSLNPCPFAANIMRLLKAVQAGAEKPHTDVGTYENPIGEPSFSEPGALVRDEVANLRKASPTSVVRAVCRDGSERLRLNHTYSTSGPR